MVRECPSVESIPASSLSSLPVEGKERGGKAKSLL